VVGLAVFDAWAEAEDVDADTRLAVLGWFHSLQLSGPPPDGSFDPFRDTWSVVIPATSVTAEYIVAPFLDPPAIAVRVLRSRRG
jgi:hypothetical protein